VIHFHIITLFPDSIEAYLASSILGRAREKKLIRISYYDPKEYAVGKHKRVDQRPYGGGPGMVLEPHAMLRAAEKALKGKPRVERIFFATDGEQFDETMAKTLAKVPRSGTKHILLISGRYEGVDARVRNFIGC
jgi:tRNA (guanine37-N1)-methyltransferase